MKAEHQPRSPARFGTVLGVGPGGVPVYSSDYATADRKELPNRQAYRHYVDGVFMGHKWQCVELARRWMFLNKGYIFDDIAMAYDIFQLRHVRVVKDGTLLPLHSFRNGSKRHPEPGALLVWNEGGTFDVTGHVAVVTEVFAERIRFIEQNVDHAVWPEGQYFSRELHTQIADDGGYWIACSYHDTEILGWVIQTDDDSHSERIADVDPRVFNLQSREVAHNGQAGDTWLNVANPEEAAYVAMMGGCRLSGNDADAYRYFRISESALKEIKRATNELHNMFMHATNHVLQDDALLRKFNLPEELWPRIHESWDNRRNQMITGRMDFSVSERGVKLYEYNADSASCHLECGKIQSMWADHFGCDDGDCPGDALFDDMVSAWKKSGVNDVLHIMQDSDPEESYHAQYMKSAVEKAGIPCKIITGLTGLGWDDRGWVVDADGVRIKWVWKTWAWETALDELRAEIADDNEKGRLTRAERMAVPPRLVDVLLRREVMVFEPLWTLIPSNKAVLPILWSMYPNNRYLLNSQYELTADLIAGGYVQKPIVGRCGHNIAIFDRNNDLVTETAGGFDNRDQIYQAFFPLPKIDGRNVQVGTFSVAGTYAGASVRVDPSPIITTDSDILALRVVKDRDL
ncbi:MAG: bifunctional glutathionylspermidine amidase/synthase [Alphaproteobacteria bacterium]